MPTIEEIYQVLRNIKEAGIDDDWYMDDEDARENRPGVQVTFGTDGSDWDYQTGDNSYTGAAYFYPHWVVIGLYRGSNCRDLARQVKAEMLEVAA